MFCPACGEQVDALMEARPVGRQVERWGNGTSHGTRLGDTRVASMPTAVVAWPCGDRIRADMAHLLIQIP